MKYIEELQNGEVFTIEDNYWLMTADFKGSGERLGYSLNSGHAKWFKGNSVVDITPVYILDKDNNILPVKNYSNDYKTSHIS